MKLHLLDSTTEDSALESRLREMLEQEAIRTVFQPIAHLTTGELLGHEALSRGPAGSALESPVALFTAAAQVGMTWEVEYACRQLAIARFASMDPGTMLFLNVSPTIIQDVRFCQGVTIQQLSTLGLSPDRIAFEITEQVVVTDSLAFSDLLDHYRHQGFKLAVDDVGDGYAGLTLISQVHPHYLKLDKTLIQGIAHDPLRQHLVRSLASFTTGMGMGMIAEGLETDEDLTCVCSLGVRYGQGFLLARPQPTPLPLDKTWRECLSSNVYGGKLLTPGQRLGAVCRTVPPISHTMTVEKLSAHWHADDTFPCLPVMKEESAPVGLIMRDALFVRLATPYGYSLYARKSVTSVMETEPLKLEKDVTVETAALQALARPESRIYEHLIVTDQGRYHGLVAVKDLLAHLTAQSLARAHTANPLTGLPGNPVIHAELARVLATGVPFTLCYCDLDHFKAFNDAYGFTRGDAVIQALATLLQAIFGPQSTTPAFIGHIGGDDFLILSDTPVPQATLDELIASFDATIPVYYDTNTQARGAMETVNRQGERVLKPVCALSIAVVTAENGPFTSPQILTQRAAEVKRTCKATPGSCVCYDRRREG